MTTPKIIDVSSNQGTIDFNKVKAAGVEHVFIRTSEGYGSKDKDCAIYAAAAVQAGLLVSYYHFAYPDTKTGGSVLTDANGEADWFVNTIQAMPKYKKLVIDLEPFGGGRDTPLSKADYALWLQTFLDHVYARTSADLIIYTYASYLTQHLPENHTFGSYKLWIANYDNIAKPPLPVGWSDYYQWQYSETGTVDGIGTKVDFTMANPAAATV